MMKLKILLVLLLSTCCFAQGGHRLSQVITRGNGIAANVVPFASVNVCVAGTFCHTLQPVFSDLALTQPLVQPVVGDAGGNFDYYVPSGCYDEQYSSPTLGTITKFNVCTGPPGGSAAGCTTSGTSIFPISNGSGGCQPADAEFDGSTFIFGSVLSPFVPKGFQVNADLANGINLNSLGSTIFLSGTGLIVTDGNANTNVGSISIVEQSHTGGIIIEDNGGGISLHANQASSTKDSGFHLNVGGGMEIAAQQLGSSVDFGFTIGNATNPATLVPTFAGQYGMNISDNTADGIFIDEVGTGQISLAANTVNFHSTSASTLLGNGSPICTQATGCTGGGATGVTSINSTAGPFTFNFSAGAGSCTGTSCTFTGSSTGGGSVISFSAPSGSWPTWLVPTVTNGGTTPSLAVAASAIPNSALANSSISINSTPCTLGGSCTVTTGAITLANVGAGASPTGLFDFSAATHLKLPSRAGYTAAASGEIGYDTTNLNLHFNIANTDLLAVGFPSASGLPVNGHCMQWTIIGAWLEATDAGAPCGSGSGGAVNSVSNSDGTLNVSPTTGAVVASLNLAHANTWTAPISVADGTGNAGSFSLKAGTTPPAATTSTVQINAPTAVTAYSINLPGAQGTGALTNDGSGNLSWTAAGAGSVTAVTGTGPIVSSGGTAPAISCPTCGVTGSPLSQFAATTSAQLAGVLSDETGTGLAVFATSPTFVTPILGTPASGVATNLTGLPIATGVSGLATGVAAFLGTPSSANLAASLTNETGTGLVVFGTSPTLVTPVLGTPTSVTLTNATGLPLTTGVTGVLPVANGGASLNLNWTFNSGSAATDAAPRFLASRTGTIANCFALTTSSDGATALTFNIFRNGTTIFSGGAQTIAAGTAAGTLTTLGALGTTAITNNDKISFNITSGTNNWVFTVSCK